MTGDIKKDFQSYYTAALRGQIEDFIMSASSSGKMTMNQARTILFGLDEFYRN